jgi:iron(III) transport system substrate-binding protein
MVWSPFPLLKQGCPPDWRFKKRFLIRSIPARDKKDSTQLLEEEMNRTRKVLWVMMVLTMIMSALMSCTPAPAATTAPTTASTSAPAKPTDAPTQAPASSGKPLIVYTNSGSDGRGDWLKQRAAQDGFQIEYVQLGAGDLANRLVAEKNNQIADLVFGLNAVEYEKLKKQDMLLKYEPAWAKTVDMTLGDKDGFYYPTVVQPLLLAYNPKIITKDAAPKDWIDLSKPEFKDKAALLAVTGGTSKTILASILVRYVDPKGTYGISDQGWKVIKDIIQNQHIVADGEDYWGNAIKGTRPMLMMWGSGLLQNEKSLNVDFDFIMPSVGVPYVVEQVAIFKNSKNIDQAKKFDEWFGSVKIQTEWSAKFGTTPAQPEALKSSAADVTALMAAVKPQNVDWAFVAANIDKWIEKIQLEDLK